MELFAKIVKNKKSLTIFANEVHCTTENDSVLKKSGSKKLWEMTMLGTCYGKCLQTTLLRQLNFTKILLKCYFITIAFAINVLERNSE